MLIGRPLLPLQQKKVRKAQIQKHQLNKEIQLHMQLAEVKVQVHLRPPMGPIRL